MKALPPMNDIPLWAWGAFVVKMNEALGWCAVWFSLAIGFNGSIWWRLGGPSALEWSTGVFGAFLVLTGIKMALPKKKEFEPEKNVVVRLFRRFYPATTQYDDGRFLAFGLAAILVFIGSKMLLTSIDVNIPIGLSLSVIGSVLAISVIASLAISPVSEREAAVAKE
jgi:predicted tellurium resistance membrane protein TerC